MKTLLHSFLLLGSTLLAAVSQAQPHTRLRTLTTTGGEQQLAQLVSTAPLIIEGRAGESRSFWDAEHRLIYTATPVTLYKVFKGEPVGSTVEVITKGGRVGNSASGCKDCGEAALGLQPTGVFFLKPIPHTDPKSPVKVAYQVVNGQDGFLKYNSFSGDGANTQSHWQLYPNVENSLYPALVGLVHKPYRVVKPFNPRAFNALREKQRVDSLMYSRMDPVPPPAKSTPAIKKKGGYKRKQQ